MLSKILCIKDLRLRRLNITQCISPTNVIFFAICTILHYICSLPIFIDGDIAWHISTGDYIRSIKGIPYFDPWSYVGQLQQWYNISWLWDILLSYAHQFLGLEKMCILTSICFGLFFTMFHCMLCNFFNIRPTHSGRIDHIRYDSILVFLSIALFVIIPGFGLRPQMASYFMFLLVHTMLSNYHALYHTTHVYESNDKPKIYLKQIFSDSAFRKLTYKICLTTIIWANLHGGFIFIGILLGVLGLEAIYKKQWLLLQRWFCLGLCALVCALINPIGYKIYVGIIRTFFSIAYNFIAEWQTFCFGRSAFHSIVVAVIIASGFAYKRRYLQLKINIYDWLLGVILLFAALDAIRGFAIFMVLGARAFVALLDSTMPTAKIPITLRNFHYSTSIISLVLMLIVLSTADPKVGRNMVPIEEINFVAKHYPGKKFINPYVYGGAIILFAKGKFKHFIDGRAGTVFPEEVLKACMEHAPGESPYWSAMFSNYEFDGIMLPKRELVNANIKEMLSGWNLVFSGPLLNVYMKRANMKFDNHGYGKITVQSANTYH